MRSARAAAAGLLALSVLVGAVPVAAVDYVVDDVNDAPLDVTVPGGGCVSTLGTCTLRAAVMRTAASSRFVDTITIPPGTYRLTLPATTPVSGAGGPLTVIRGASLLIRGAGADATIIEQTAAGSVIRGGGDDVTLEGLTITGGNFTDPVIGGGGISVSGHTALRAVIVRGNHSDGSGGGILSIGHLELTESVVTDNTASSGAGISAGGTLEITHSAIARNTASGRGGGGIAWGPSGGASAAFRVSRSIIADNHAIGPAEEAPGGGGILLSLLDLFGPVDDIRIVDTTIRDNTSSFFGGGLHTYGFHTVHVERSLFTNNSARVGGGASLRSPADFTNTTFSGNSAPFGGGISLSDPFVCFDAGPHTTCARASVGLRFSTLAGNTGEDGSGFRSDSPRNRLQLVGTILANTPAEENCDRFFTPESLGSNLETGTRCGLSGPGDLSSTDPRLLPLADNGGWTFTHALDAGSPAIDAATFSPCPRYDQRFALRPAGARCDIGAYEAGAAFFVLPIRLTDEGLFNLLLAPAAAGALGKGSVKLGAAAPAQLGQDGLTFSEPLAEAWVGDQASRLLGRGGLVLTGPKGAVALSEWELHIGDGHGSVLVRLEDRRLPFLTLSGTTRTVEGWTVTGKAHAAIHPAGAAALNKALGTTAFGSRMELGVIHFQLDAEAQLGGGIGQPPAPADNPNG